MNTQERKRLGNFLGNETDAGVNFQQNKKTKHSSKYIRTQKRDNEDSDCTSSASEIVEVFANDNNIPEENIYGTSDEQQNESDFEDQVEVLTENSSVIANENSEDDSNTEVSDSESESESVYFHETVKKINYEGFDLENLINELMEKVKDFSPAFDHFDKIFDDDLISPTKGDFACGLAEYFAESQTKITDQNALIAFLGKMLKNHCNLPFHYDENGDAKSRIYKHVPQNDEAIKVDVCKMGDFVFIGPNKDKHMCPKCGSHRFLNLDSAVTAKKTLIYRPIAVTITKLLMLPRFLDVLNYEYVKPDIGEDTEFMDIRDGEEYIKNEREMHEIFIKKFGENSDVIEVSLLLSTFYDGGQVYKHKVVPFWPLFISILNLPPQFRSKLHIGSFVVSVLSVASPCF